MCLKLFRQYLTRKQVFSTSKAESEQQAHPSLYCISIYALKYVYGNALLVYLLQSRKYSINLQLGRCLISIQKISVVALLVFFPCRIACSVHVPRRKQKRSQEQKYLLGLDILARPLGVLHLYTYTTPVLHLLTPINFLVWVENITCFLT